MARLWQHWEGRELYPTSPAPGPGAAWTSPQSDPESTSGTGGPLLPRSQLVHAAPWGWGAWSSPPREASRAPQPRLLFLENGTEMGFFWTPRWELGCREEGRGRGRRRQTQRRLQRRMQLSLKDRTVCGGRGSERPLVSRAPQLRLMKSPLCVTAPLMCWGDSPSSLPEGPPGAPSPQGQGCPTRRPRQAQGPADVARTW